MPKPLSSDDAAELERLRFEVGERRKELAAMHTLARCLIRARDTGTARWLQEAVELIPPSFQFPALTEASVRLGDVHATTSGFADRVTAQAPRIRAEWHDTDGTLCVVEAVYVGAPMEGPTFLAEEYPLVESIADLIRSAMLCVHESRRSEGAQQALRFSEDRLEVALAAANMGIIEWDLIGEIAHISETTRILFGLPEGMTTATPEAMRNCIHAEDRDRVRQYFHFERTTGSVRQHEYRVQLPDGTVRWLSTRGRIFHDAEGRAVRRLSVVYDITDRKALEDQFRHAQKLEAMGRLAGGVAHDFNNLLTVIGAAGEFIMEAAPADGTVRTDIEVVLAAVERGRSLTRHLLTFSRRQVVRRVRFDLNALVSNTESMLLRLVGSEVSLRIEPAPAPILVEADPSQLEQVVMNLAVNARDAMPEGGELAIRMEHVTLDEAAVLPRLGMETGDYALLTVSDTGVGMDETVRARIFEPFFTTKDELHGTGLGLATVFGIVKQAGGTVSVYSEPGMGATFRVYLPLAASDAADESDHVAEVESVPRGSETILLVEDEPRVRMLSRRILMDLGYTIIEAGDGIEALELAQTYPNHIHLMLCDVVLPGHNGREVSEALALSRPEIPVLFMSGYTADVLLHQNLTMTGAPFLEKPFTRQSLAVAVRRAIDAES